VFDVLDLLVIVEVRLARPLERCVAFSVLHPFTS
jgi:hypothetical protein